MKKVEAAFGKKFGDTSDPLLVSVRSGAALSRPGMTYAPFFRRAMQAIRTESPRNAARWVGSLLHFVQDAGSPAWNSNSSRFQHHRVRQRGGLGRQREHDVEVLDRQKRVPASERGPEPVTAA